MSERNHFIFLMLTSVVSWFFVSCEMKVSYTSSSEPSRLDELLSHLNWGSIAFNVPPSMGYGEAKTIHVLLNAAKSPEQLQQIIDEEGTKEGYRIQISDRMEAHLTGNGFDIIPITPEAQPVSVKQTTDWKWDITAKRFGSQHLHLSLNALLKLNGENTTRSIRTFDRDISINVVWPTSFLAFAQDHWQILSGIIAAIFGALVWIFGSRRNKN